MAQQNWVLTDSERGIHQEDFSKQLAGRGSVKRQTLRGGKREGVDTIEINNGALTFSVVPTRGMGLWKARLGDLELGWNSPVKGPVHPQWVPLTEPSGLGWLEGFDELVCRCGLVNNGAPDLMDCGAYKYPLHGRIANLPAHYVELVSDSDADELRLTGHVDETRFLFQKLRMSSTYATKLGQSGLRIIDEVTNLSGDPTEIQMLYHINFGPPVLDPGAKVVAPIKAMTPRDKRAAEGVSAWDSYPNEQPAFSEQVYFFELLADKDKRTQVLLKNAHGTAGVSLRYSIEQLPYFTLWKNTQMAADGYVTGLEPGTNFPNPRSFEGEQGRVVKLQPGGSVRFEVELNVHGDAASVAEAEENIKKLQATASPKIHATPQAGWTRV